MQEVDRTRRVSALIKRELSVLIQRELNDNRINSVSLLSVNVTRDLKQATIYVSSADSHTPKQEVEKLLNNAAKFLRRLLSQQIELRITPALVFKYDDSIERGVKMSSLISELNKDSHKPVDDSDADV